MNRASITALFLLNMMHVATQCQADEPSSNKTYLISLKLETPGIRINADKDLLQTLEKVKIPGAPEIITTVAGVAGIGLAYSGLQSLMNDIKASAKGEEKTGWQFGADALETAAGLLVVAVSLYVWHNYLRTEPDPSKLKLDATKQQKAIPSANPILGKP